MMWPKQVRGYLAAGVPVGSDLADQLMLPLGISAWQGADRPNGPEPNGQRGGAYRTLPLSRHATTHIDLLRRFLGIAIDVDQSSTGGSCTVQIGPPAGISDAIENGLCETVPAVYLLIADC